MLPESSICYICTNFQEEYRELHIGAGALGLMNAKSVGFFSFQLSGVVLRPIRESKRSQPLTSS